MIVTQHRRQHSGNAALNASHTSVSISYLRTLLPKVLGTGDAEVIVWMPRCNAKPDMSPQRLDSPFFCPRDVTLVSACLHFTLFARRRSFLVFLLLKI